MKAFFFAFEMGAHLAIYIRTGILMGLNERRILYWEGSSKKAFKTFPASVQKDLGIALFVVQLGRTPPSAQHAQGGRGADRETS
jgi:hypothetical protein